MLPQAPVREVHMTGQSLVHYAREVCRQLEEGFDRVRLLRAAGAIVIPVATLATGCIEFPIATPDYGVPFEDEYDCTDGEDDDWDGLTDCDDPDCRIEVCLSCFDGVDNDGDGDADCHDADCAAGEGCQRLCDDGLDNDGDGRADCDDSDCAGSTACP